MSHPTKFVKIVSPLALAIALAACGGSGDNSFSENGGGTSGGGGSTLVKKASSIVLKVSSHQLASDGSKPITITAIAKDKNNAAISGADIIFSVDNDATIDTEAVATTGKKTASGSVKTASLTPGKPKNRTLKVTAKSGSASETITIDVIGTSVVIDGPDAITLNKEIPFVLKLKDSSNKPISFEQVELTSSAGNTIKTESNLQTDAIGEVAFTLMGSAGGTDTLTAKVLGVTYIKPVIVSGDEFVLSGNHDEININSPETIQFVWKKEGVPQANKPIIISATRGTIDNQTVTTNAAGVATFKITSTTAGKTVITATSADGLSASLSKEFIATTPAYLNTQADPSLIAPKGSSTIVAKIRDVNDNPVKNKVIDFRLNDTVNGVLSSSTAVTDSLGRASISYTAGNSSSAKDGVEIKTFIQGYSVKEDKVFLTVGGDALRIVLGQDQLLSKSDVFYVKQFGVIVTDSAGNPIKGQKIDFTVIPSHYYKGFMRVVDTDGDGKGDAWAQYQTSPECISEDFDNDGNLDAGEDLNGNGTLEPTHDATITNTGVTDEQGKIVVELVYPKSRALWSKQVITATTRVEGTEFVERTDIILPLSADDASDIEVGVPNALSPYGLSSSCDNDDSTYDAPINAQIVDALSGAAVMALEHNIWYTVRFTDALGSQVSNKTFKVESSVVTIVPGPNNTFKLVDRDNNFDNSGYFITLNVDGKSTPIFYKDSPVGAGDGPIISLTGPDTVNLHVGDAYVEEGANAVDEEDGVLSVIIYGHVDTTKKGTYVIIYRAADKNGNKVSITRTVNVDNP